MFCIGNHVCCIYKDTQRNFTTLCLRQNTDNILSRSNSDSQTSEFLNVFLIVAKIYTHYTKILVKLKKQASVEIALLAMNVKSLTPQGNFSVYPLASDNAV